MSKKKFGGGGERAGGHKCGNSHSHAHGHTHGHPHNHLHSHLEGKTERNILVAFLLNVGFSIFEFFGGLFTGSVAILSDALHDAGDALSIGLSYFLEKKSLKGRDADYTFGYRRYSTVGALVSTVILLVGSGVVIAGAVARLFEPAEINEDGMIGVAVFGLVVNFVAAWVTRGGGSLNQRAVNLHMLEDVLGWAVVLVGAIVIKLTGFYQIDAVMSIGIAIFLIVESLKVLRRVMRLILEKAPEDVSVSEVRKAVTEVKGVKEVHHIHIWSLDGEKNLATMHVVGAAIAKKAIKARLKELGIHDATIEVESVGEDCSGECEL